MGSVETTRLIHEEKSNMRLADIEFTSEKEARENEIPDSDDEEVSMSMIEAMAKMRS